MLLTPLLSSRQKPLRGIKFVDLAFGSARVSVSFDFRDCHDFEEKREA